MFEQNQQDFHRWFVNMNEIGKQFYYFMIKKKVRTMSCKRKGCSKWRKDSSINRDFVGDSWPKWWIMRQVPRMIYNCLIGVHTSFDFVWSALSHGNTTVCLRLKNVPTKLLYEESHHHKRRIECLRLGMLCRLYLGNVKEYINE